MSAPLRVRAVPAPAPAPGSRERPRGVGAPDARRAPRPQLRLVDDARLQRAARQRRARRLAVTAAVMAGLVFMALAGSHAFLVTNQVRIDELQQRVDEAQARHQALRLQVATLEAPDRIVSVAQDDLGLVRPDEVTYLRPAARPLPAPASDLDDPQAPPAPEGAAPSWGAVKPYLGRGA